MDYIAAAVLFGIVIGIHIGRYMQKIGWWDEKS